MHFASLIAFVALTFFTSTQALPVSVEVLNDSSPTDAVAHAVDRLLSLTEAKGQGSPGWKRSALEPNTPVPPPWKREADSEGSPAWKRKESSISSPPWRRTTTTTPPPPTPDWKRQMDSSVPPGSPDWRREAEESVPPPWKRTSEQSASPPWKRSYA
ncbi:hypothetical protein M413DRAFT_448789 [Hebeloma cylindrosporum]|uniref:Uncharacterized protein n=1 Tax=Hebeloma cylindrosporum TaxID=76867 RepID=A0A0C2XGY1_HEBCY|nr:hypothetical protein M413DRAFT_448789 [Hebeloma cylindrosporum h7]